jgi:hypothetical protein
MSDTDIAVIDDITPLAQLSPEIQAKIKARADQIKAGCSVSVRRIPHRAKGFVDPEGNEMASFVGVIVGNLHANMHYNGTYQRGQTNSLDCYAYGNGETKDLAPASEVVGRYATNCGTCAKFQWGSGQGGRGKECGEHTCLAVYVPALGDDIFVVDMKKGNSRIADNYLVNVTNKYGDPIAVMTTFQIGLKKDWEVTLTATKMADADLVANLAGRMEEAKDILVERVRGPYNAPATSVTDDDDPDAPPA